MEKLGLLEKQVASSPHYRTLRAPHPNPRSIQEITANLETEYIVLRGGKENVRVPDEERTFYTALLNGDLRIESERVETWTRLRCRPGSPQLFTYLVRAFLDDQEIARFSMKEDGTLGSFVFLDPELYRLELFSIPEAISYIETLVSLPPGKKLQAQYVNSYGHGRCDPLSPCVAVRHGRTTYLLQNTPTKELFRFDETSRRLSPVEMAERKHPSAGLEPTADGVELFSIGGGEWVEARRVGPPG